MPKSSRQMGTVRVKRSTGLTGEYRARPAAGSEAGWDEAGRDRATGSRAHPVAGRGRGLGHRAAFAVAFGLDGAAAGADQIGPAGGVAGLVVQQLAQDLGQDRGLAEVD